VKPKGLRPEWDSGYGVNRDPAPSSPAATTNREHCSSCAYRSYPFEGLAITLGKAPNAPPFWSVQP
jgi:hypothetical protein